MIQVSNLSKRMADAIAYVLPDTYDNLSLKDLLEACDAAIKSLDAALERKKK